MKSVSIIIAILLSFSVHAQNAFFTRKNEVSVKYGWWGSPTGGINGWGVVGAEGRRNLSKRWSIKADINFIYKGNNDISGIIASIDAPKPLATDRWRGLWTREPYGDYVQYLWINAGMQYHCLNSKRHDLSIGMDATFSSFNTQESYRPVTFNDPPNYSVIRQRIVAGGNTLGFNGYLNYNFKPTERLVVGGTFNVMHLWDASNILFYEPDFSVFVPITFKIGILFD
jgi:hypothetical protein